MRKPFGDHTFDCAPPMPMSDHALSDDPFAKPLFKATLRPYRSLKLEGFRLMMALVAGASIIASIPAQGWRTCWATPPPAFGGGRCAWPVRSNAATCLRRQRLRSKPSLCANA